jgi:DNA-binding transcriptional ArsR family regulator
MKDSDKVFKALADASRRSLIDRLHERSGQTLTELCEGLAMTRQAVTQHLAVLGEANLVSARWRGREKLHFFNPVPLHDIYERWIRKFEKQRLSALHEFKRQLERENEK